MASSSREGGRVCGRRKRRARSHLLMTLDESGGELRGREAGKREEQAEGGDAAPGEEAEDDLENGRN